MTITVTEWIVGADTRLYRHGRTPIGAASGGGGTLPPGVKPVRENSGWVAAGSPALTSYAAGVKSGINGLVLENRSVPGDLDFADGCSNITIRNCVIEGELKVRECTTVLIEYTDAQAFVVDGAHGHEMRYCYATGKVNVDGLQVKADGGAVPTDVYIHHNFFGNASTTDTGHYDGVQVRGVNGLRLEYNNFDPAPTFDDNQNVAVFIQDANGGNWNIQVRNNWISAMGYGHLTIGVQDTIHVTDNVFFRSPALGGVVKGTVLGTVVQSGNAWDDGTPISDILTERK